MKLLDFLLANHVPLNVKNYKVHLASHAPDGDSPLQAFLNGRFQEWQEAQTKRNFPREHVISLIQLSERDRGLFAGVYKVLDHEWNESIKRFVYNTELLDGQKDWIGRVIVQHHRTARQPYLNGALDGGPFAVCAIREQRMSIEEFPGFNWTCVPYVKLKTIVGQDVVSWRSPLSKVKGIYLITDMFTGKQYVGKADGQSGIWQRWCSYVTFGHGGNKELRELLCSNPPEYLEHFQFSILEIADLQTSDLEIDARESHWKEVLRTREHGYNSN